MKLSQLAAKPQLIEINLEDEDIIARFGEPLEFYIWDRQPMDTFVKLATVDYKEFGKVAEIIKELVLDETGKPIVNDESMLPTDLMMRAINRVVETLGKSVAPVSTKVTETSK